MFTNLIERINRLDSLLKMVKPIPEEWVKDVKVDPNANKEGRAAGVSPVPCNNYKTLIAAWKKAMRWRDDMDYVFSIMLAVAASTEQVGDQLFLMLISDAGSGKTKLCDGMLVSPRCYALEHITGFHSGWHDSSGEDFSLISRINRKCLITPEGDIMMASPKFSEIMSQQRRIFDGTSGASYKNRKEDVRYTGLRTPWIIVGTPALMATDQSRLGDRFLKVYLNQPPDDEKSEILKSVGYTALRSVMRSSNGAPESHIEEYLLKAYQLTGGFIDHIGNNIEELLSKLEIDDEKVVTRCAVLGKFTALLRARPDNRSTREIDDTTELPTRLTHQYVRLACCLAVVLGQKRVDGEVMRRVTRVAIDTAKGQTLEMVRYMYRRPNGVVPQEMSTHLSKEEYSMTRLVRFLTKIKVLEHFKADHEKAKGISKWRLTKEMRELCEQVVETKKG